MQREACSVIPVKSEGKRHLINFHRERLLTELKSSSTVEKPSIPWNFFPEVITIVNCKFEIISNVLRVCGGENKLCRMFFSADLFFVSYNFLCYVSHLTVHP